MVEAIEAFAAVEDDAACAAAVTVVLDKWPDLHGRLRQIRQERVNALRDAGRTWAEIGSILGGKTPARAQQISVGLRGTKRPPKKGEPSAE
nr:hypothetical protein [Streptomyces sp. SID5468]